MVLLCAILTCRWNFVFKNHITALQQQVKDKSVSCLINEVVSMIIFAEL